jgi:hypothetical protein
VDFVEAVVALEDAAAVEDDAVFGDACGGDFEALGKLHGGQGFAFEQFVEDAPAGFVGDGGEEVLPDEQFTS